MPMVGTASRATPSWVEAALAVERLVESLACTVAAMTEVVTSIVAVMITEPAWTVMVTSEESTPAIVAILCCRFHFEASE